MRRIVRTALPWLAALAVGLAVPALASPWSPLVERWYAAKVFPHLAAALAFGANLVPFSLGQLALLFALGAFVVSLVLAAFEAAKKRSAGPLAAWAASGFKLATLGVWMFHLVWGLNYARLPASERLGLEPAEADQAHLAAVVRKLAKDANDSYRMAIDRGELEAGAAGSRLLLDHTKLAGGLSLAHALHNARMGRVDLAGPKSPAILSACMSRLGISGIYLPWSGEATVNGMQPDASIPFVTAHEMAHQRGTAREDEANFLGWLACRESGIAAARYSASLAAYGTALGALADAAPDSARALAGTLLAPGPAADRRGIHAFWTRYEGAAERVATRVNDTYLKTNAQRSGVSSYGRMVDLLLAHDQAGRWDPGW